MGGGPGPSRHQAANLLVRDGRLYLIDVFFTEVRPSPWRQGVDLANMLLVLALGRESGRVYERALRRFTVEEIGEAFAATRGLTMPSQLTLMVLVGAFLAVGFVVSNLNGLGLTRADGVMPAVILPNRSSGTEPWGRTAPVAG